MSNTIKFGIIIFAVIVVFMSTAYCSSQKGKTVEYTYEISQEVLNNPLIGYAPTADSTTSVGDNSLVYIDILWSELEPEEGKYNFAKIDESNYVEKWIGEGKHAVLRFICDLPSDEKHMDIPQWLYDKIEGDGTYYDYDGRFGFSPDYNNPLLIKYHELAIKALGAHFGSSTFVSYVELGSLGHWGEWHVNYESGIDRIPKADIRELYIKPYISAFPNAKMMMRRPFIAAKEHGFGLFDDMAGHPTDSEEWLGWIQNGGDYSQAEEDDALVSMVDSWKTAPVGGEFTSSYKMDYLLKFNLSTTKDLIKRSHTSFLGPQCPTPSTIEKYDCGSQADEVKNTMGYRFRISKAYIANFQHNANAKVTMMWVNDGIAPIYWNWNVYLYLYDKDKKYLTKVPVDIQLTNLFSDTSVMTNTVIQSDNLGSDAHYLCVGIEDPMTKKPAIKFGMKTEYIQNTAVLAEMGK